MTRRALTTLTLILMSSAAFGGKDEREYMNHDLGPAAKAAETAFKASCGCPLKIAFNETTTKSTNDMYVAKHIVDKITGGAPGYCTDAESKKAVCQLKSLEIGKGAAAGFTFKAGKGVSLHDGQNFLDFERMTKELDK